MSSDFFTGPEDAGDLWCPLCGAVVYAEAQQCPACKEYITPGLPPAGPRGGRRKVLLGFIALLVILALLAMLLAR